MAEGGGSLKAVTTNMRPGYLRRNGVPYSANAKLTEYLDLATLPGGGQALLVTAVVEDPQYLQLPFIVTSQFKKETDGGLSLTFSERADGYGRSRSLHSRKKQLMSGRRRQG